MLPLSNIHALNQDANHITTLSSTHNAKFTMHHLHFNCGRSQFTCLCWRDCLWIPFRIQQSIKGIRDNSNYCTLAHSNLTYSIIHNNRKRPIITFQELLSGIIIILYVPIILYLWLKRRRARYLDVYYTKTICQKNF